MDFTPHTHKSIFLNILVRQGLPVGSSQEYTAKLFTATARHIGFEQLYKNLLISSPKFSNPMFEISPNPVKSFAQPTSSMSRNP